MAEEFLKNYIKNILCYGRKSSVNMQNAHQDLEKADVLSSQKQVYRKINKTELETQNKILRIKEELKQKELSLVPQTHPKTVPDARPKHNKPLKTTNILDRSEAFDTLHEKAPETMHCTRNVCTGSTMFSNLVGTDPRKPEDIFEQAEDFLKQYYTSIKQLNSEPHVDRWNQVKKEIETKGTYHLTETELLFGAKLAWRNAARCIGRIQWNKLQLFDCRHITTPREMFEALCNHVKYATNGGNIRSAITVFPQRTDGKHDYRIWNSQLISYAGHKNSDGTFLGDPLNAPITELCIKLGWKPKRTPWDILPMVLSANGNDPEFFEYPEDLILQVPLSHPTMEWFEDMKLRWYALPAVANMSFDCGGIVFPGTAFSGWYMSTEIGCRNLCDANRRNLLEPIAIKMGLDTRNPTSLWKDKALVEINIAVLHSFQKLNVTIVDHHTASETFMKHFENEMKSRKGCPSDWIWIVPPMSGSLTEVYHQEMIAYYLKPSFDYQIPPTKTHIWKKYGDANKPEVPRKKFHLKEIALAIQFASILYQKALSKRVKATVLYATETGKSEKFAKQLVNLFGRAFNAKIYSMEEYEFDSIKLEELLLVVASTFGNGNPPENGEQFSQKLYELNTQKQKHSLNRLKFSVFGLGSTSYPNFCAFGKYLDKNLKELGGERLTEVACGDEMSGQDQEFRKWAPLVFKTSCESFSLDVADATKDSMIPKIEVLTVDTVRFEPVTKNKTEPSLDKLLSKYHNKNVKVCQVLRKPIDLHANKLSSDRSTILIEIKANGLKYEPGDHAAIYPINRKEFVNGVLRHITGVTDPDEILQHQIFRENQTPNGVSKSWENHERLPPCSLRTLLTRFLDISAAPSRPLLTFLMDWCKDQNERERMNKLATDLSTYEDWKNSKLPHLLHVFEEFPSCKPPAALLVTHLTPLQARFYSISSSQKKVLDEIHLTVAVVQYQNEDGRDRYGVCSNYLANSDENDDLHLFIRSAPGFHIPTKLDHPMILVGPGTGIAPFRGFWQEMEELKKKNTSMVIPKIWLFFGCRTKDMDLYRNEKEEMVQKKILDRTVLALSREQGVPKTYVQDIALMEANEIYRILVKEKGHVYVCGDCTMAEHFYQTLIQIISTREKQTEAVVEKFMLQLRNENRYHEDIFGITSRPAEAKKAVKEA